MSDFSENRVTFPTFVFIFLTALYIVFALEAWAGEKNNADKHDT